MSEDRSPELQALFANADQDLQNDSFTRQVMTGIDRQVRRRRALLALAALAMLAVLWLLAPVLQEIVLLLTSLFNISLITLNDPLISQLLLPVNNIACLTVVGGLLVRTIYRKLFHRS